MSVLNRVFRIAEGFLRGLACTALLAMMMLTTLDVVGRYAFNRPVSGALEVTEVLLVIAIFGGLPSVSRGDQHIRVDLTEGMLSTNAGRICNALVEFVTSAASFGVAYIVFRKAQTLATYNDASALLSIPLAPVAFFMSALLLLMGVAQLLLIADRLRGRAVGASISAGDAL